MNEASFEVVFWLYHSDIMVYMLGSKTENAQ
jgi:hypothetical protein